MSCCATFVASDCVHRLHRKGVGREKAGEGVSGEQARPQTSTSLAQ